LPYIVRPLMVPVEGKVTVDRLSGRLLPGETVLWAGRPQQGLLFTRQDGLLIPFSLLWGGFAIFWETMALRAQAPGFFQLWGAPFVLIGLYLIAGRFAVDAWLRSRMQYAVTNRRVLILRSGWFSDSVTSIGLDRLPIMQLSERTSGRGTIRFGGFDAVNWALGLGIWAPALNPIPQFIGIPNAYEVYAQIEQAARRTA